MLDIKQSPENVIISSELVRCEYCGFEEISAIKCYCEEGKERLACKECFDCLHSGSLDANSYLVVALPGVSQTSLFHLLRASALIIVRHRDSLDRSNRRLTGSRTQVKKHAAFVNTQMLLKDIMIKHQKTLSDINFMYSLLDEDEENSDIWHKIKRLHQTLPQKSAHEFLSSLKIIPLKISDIRINNWYLKGSFIEYTASRINESNWFGETIDRDQIDIEVLHSNDEMKPEKKQDMNCDSMIGVQEQEK